MTATLTVGTALDLAAQQCANRHLQDTASWLSELALSGDAPVLNATARHALPALSTLPLAAALRPSEGRPSSPRSTAGAARAVPPRESLCARETDAWYHVLHMDDVLALETAEASRAAQEALSQTGAAPTQKAAERLARWRRLHRLALVLLSKGEYRRCHSLLAKVIQEESGAADGGDSTLSSASPQGRPTQGSVSGGDADGQRDAPGHATGSSLDLDGVSSPAQRVSFGLTITPSCLQFLCLYALFLDGQRASVTAAAGAYQGSAAAAAGHGAGGMAGPALRLRSSRSVNPHLRLLRGMLLEALGNSANAVVMPNDLEQPSASSTFHTPSPHGGARTAHQPRSSAAPATSDHDGLTSANVTASAAVDRVADPFLCWLLGVVLRDLGMKQESASYLMASLQVHPFLWCAWQDLSTLVSRDSQLDDVVHALMPTLSKTVSTATTMSTASATGAHRHGDVGALPLMLSIFLAHTRAALGVAPTPRPDLTEAAGVPLSRGPTRAPASARGTTQGSADGRSASGLADDELCFSSAAPKSPPAERTPVNVEEAKREGDATASSAAAMTAEARTTWELLLRDFPRNPWFLQHLAGYHYHLCRELDVAQQLYERLLHADPCRLEGTTDYSNILFMRHDRLALSSLAQRCYQLDPFRAESNFVVGNYYVLLRQHERSVLHFRRAVAIEPCFAAAWTLLGHAYLETRNTTAAVEAYGVAVELDPRDYRGWYNLGQVYELLQAYHHALYYYWHTTSLRANDPRMWTAVANCLEHDGRLSEGVVCLARAEACESPAAATYPALVRRIAEYYIGEGNMPRACVYLQRLISAHAASADDLLFALPFLVQQRLREVERLAEVPARSPSYDAIALRHGSGGTGGSGVWPSSSSANPFQASPRDSGASSASPALATAPHSPTRGDRALALLDEVESYLRMVEQLDMNTAAAARPAPSANPDRSIPASATAPEAVAVTDTHRGDVGADRRTELAEFVRLRRRDVQMNRNLIEHSHACARPQ